MTKTSRVEVGMQPHVFVLIRGKSSELHPVGSSREGRRGRREAEDDEEAVKLLGLAERHGITGVAHHPIAVRLVDEPQES